MMKRRIITGFIIGILCLVTLCSCGKSEKNVDNSNKTTNENSGNTSEEQKEVAPENKIKMEDLKFEPTTVVDNDKRLVVLKLTNNSKYIITEFELSYKVKSDVTEQQKETFYQEVAEDFSFNQDDIEQLKENDISMHASSKCLIDVGETSTKIRCFYFDGAYYLRRMEHLNLCEPDIATIKFIDQGQVYTINYDYTNDIYSSESEAVAADQWSTKPLAEKVPKIKAKYIEAGRDDEKIFMFDAYGLTMKDFESYVDDCQKMGYTKNESSFEGFYSADNKEGYNVYLSYEEENGSISGTIEAPEKK